MTQIQLDLSGSKGLAPHHFGDSNYSTSSPNLRYLGVDGQMAEGIYNPFKRNGYLAPANFSTRNVTVSGNAMFRSNTVSQYDPINQEIYFSGIIQLSRGANSATTLTATTGSLVNNNNGYQDLEIYQLNGVPYLYALYMNSSNVQCIAGIALTGHAWDAANIVGASGTITNNTTLSTKATKMIAADNGYLYVLDNTKIQQIDGTTVGGSAGTLSSPAPILFPSYSSMSDGIDFGGNLYIGLHLFPHDVYGESLATVDFSGVCGVYIWDRQSTVFGRQNFIVTPQAKFIRKLFISPAGSVRCIATLTNGETGILEFNGYAFKTICRLGYRAFPPYIDSAQVGAGGIWWQGLDGNMYFYGSPSFEMPEGLFNLGKTSANSVTGQAILFGTNGSDYSPATPTGVAGTPEGFYRAYLDSGTYYLKKWYLNADSDSTNLITIAAQAGNVYTPVKYLPELSTVGSINIYCIPTGGSIQAGTVQIASMDSLASGGGTWAASTGQTQNVALDSTTFHEGTGSIKFDLQSNGFQAGIQNTTLTSLDLSLYASIGSWTYWIYIPDRTYLDHLLFYFGSSTSNYWSKQNITTDINGAALQNGWNQIRVDWSGTSVTGTPNAAAVTYVRADAYYIYRGFDVLPAQVGIRIDDINLSTPGDAVTNVAAISFYANQSATAFKTVTVTSADIAKGYLHYELNKPYVNAFQMKISWNTSYAVGTNDFNPSIALIETKPATITGSMPRR